jgi:hypothetical protein
MQFLSGYQSCQFIKNHQCFRDHVCTHHQGNDVTLCPDRPTYIPPKRLCSILSTSKVKCLLTLPLLPAWCISVLLQHICHQVPGLTECEACYVAGVKLHLSSPLYHAVHISYCLIQNGDAAEINVNIQGLRLALSSDATD